MAGTQPVAVYALRIPPGDILVPAVPEFAAMFRVTMAAIDPTAEPEFEDIVDHKPKATLKIVRIADADLLDDDDDEDDDEDFEDIDDDEDESSEDEELNGGPSNKKSGGQKKLEAADDDEEDSESDSDNSADQAEALENLQKAVAASKKGKAKAVDGEEESDDDDEDDESLELDECVVCTLDPEKQYQQPLDLVVGEGEKVFFKVSGTHTIHLTGNYLLPLDDISDSEEGDDEDMYGMSDEDEELDLLEDGDEESDELDDIADPRIMEVDSEEDAAPKALPAPKKGKNKRPAEDSDDETGTLDDMMGKALKKQDPIPATSEEPAKKLTKSEKKKLKKLKNNEGEAATAPEQAKPVNTKEPQTNGTTDSDKKKVQFAKNLEQGPTPSATKPEDKKSSSSLGVRNVQGVSVDDRKAGSGPAAKKGSKLELRYIGKLENGKQFDANKSGKPFMVKLGANEVIKGWEIGLQGISAGGERRITIPPGLAYGNKEIPGIPKNSKLIFDIKCLSVK